ncbi:polyphosphate polymerase domain-containing protein [Candidatus Peregrinibacteria bacterium]|nr:polyphosphate polymerase domain-containing protein [Candidatus Peregrinibacteria bacterium]
MQKIVKNIDGLDFVGIQKGTDSLFLSRKDYKFVLPVEKMEDVISYLKTDFFCNEFEEECVFQYHNIYFDTNDFKFFNQHRQGKYNRIKIRIRNYKNGKQNSFFECKRKVNGENTKKERVKIDAGQSHENTLRSNIALKHLDRYNLNSTELSQKTHITYNRISFVSKLSDIRISIDFDLCAKLGEGENKEIIPGFFILEVKSSKYPGKIISTLIRNFKTRKVSFSKYCVSLCKLNRELKQNNWKQVLKKYT